jgi:hypothetical protein
MTAWSYIWIGALLKVPAVGFVWLVWRALRGSEERQTEPAGEDGGGGSKLRLDPHPRPHVPRRPRRGPHGAAPLPAPSRIRSVNARACKVGR